MMATGIWIGPTQLAGVLTASIEELAVIDGTSNSVQGLSRTALKGLRDVEPQCLTAIEHLSS